MSTATPSPSKSPIRTTLEEDALVKLRGELQPTLVELIDLALIGKQLHWNVVGPNFRNLHLQLDELVESWRMWSDEVAERMVTVGIAADGRAQRVAGDTPFDAVSDDWVADTDVPGILADRMEPVIRRVRKRIDKVSEIDPGSEDMLIEVLTGLEEQLWMVSVQNAR